MTIALCVWVKNPYIKKCTLLTSPEACCTDVCSRIVTPVSRKGHDVLACERQQWGFTLNVSTYFTEPVSSDVAYVIVSDYDIIYVCMYVDLRMLTIQKMSAEPGRKAPYSIDLRHRMIWQKVGMGLTFREVAKNLNVALGTVYNVFRRFEQTGGVDPKHPDRTSTRKLSSSEELIVIGLILDNPGLYLGETCQKIAEITGTQVSPSTICRILHKHGLTCKKIQQVALQRSVITRAKFMADVQFSTLIKLYGWMRQDVTDVIRFGNMGTA